MSGQQAPQRADEPRAATQTSLQPVGTSMASQRTSRAEHLLAGALRLYRRTIPGSAGRASVEGTVAGWARRATPRPPYPFTGCRRHHLPS